MTIHPETSYKIPETLSFKDTSTALSDNEIVNNNLSKVAKFSRNHFHHKVYFSYDKRTRCFLKQATHFLALSEIEIHNFSFSNAQSPCFSHAETVSIKKIALIFREHYKNENNDIFLSYKEIDQAVEFQMELQQVIEDAEKITQFIQEYFRVTVAFSTISYSNSKLAPISQKKDFITAYEELNKGASIFNQVISIETSVKYLDNKLEKFKNLTPRNYLSNKDYLIIYLKFIDKFKEKIKELNNSFPKNVFLKRTKKFKLKLQDIKQRVEQIELLTIDNPLRKIVDNLFKRPTFLETESSTPIPVKDIIHAKVVLSVILEKIKDLLEKMLKLPLSLEDQEAIQTIMKTFSIEDNKKNKYLQRIQINSINSLAKSITKSDLEDSKYTPLEELFLELASDLSRLHNFIEVRGSYRSFEVSTSVVVAFS
jgi:hypothetical protein